MSLVAERLTHVYGAGTPFETLALDGVDLTINAGEFVGIIGPTGSGKSTLIQHFNGLLKPTSGRVVVDGEDLTSKTGGRAARRKVGLVFQFPEHQLFEETVFADVAFGPRNLGLGDAEIKDRVEEALKLVGLDSGQVGDRSPFSLSGGQMRRVALAGILAMRPAVLILDEPTSGLDPRGREEILGHVTQLHRARGLTVVLVSHNMEDVARLVSHVFVLDRGRLIMAGPTREVYSRSAELKAIGLDVPPVSGLLGELRRRGVDVPAGALTVEEAAGHLLAAYSRRRAATSRGGGAR
jgi:energy-coupling factor transport system ATP-binding protein